MTETKLDRNGHIINIPGYDIIRKDRTCGGGGVAVLYWNYLTCRTIQFSDMNLENTKIEILMIKFQIGKEKSFTIMP